MREIRLLWVTIGGVLIGVLNWLMTGLISGGFDPFDSSLGMRVNQIILAVCAMRLAWLYRARIWLLFLLCAHIGLNAASYFLGSSETRAWFLLGVFTSVVFLLLPAALASGLSLLEPFNASAPIKATPQALERLIDKCRKFLY